MLDNHGTLSSGLIFLKKTTRQGISLETAQNSKRLKSAVNVKAGRKQKVHEVWNFQYQPVLWPLPGQILTSLKDQVSEVVLEKCAYKHTEEARELCLLHIQVIVHETPLSTLRSVKEDTVQHHHQSHCHGNRTSSSVVKTTCSWLGQSNDVSWGNTEVSGYWSEWKERQREQEEPRRRWRPKCQRELRQREDNLICPWRAAENKQKPVKLPVGRSGFTVHTEVCQLLRIKNKTPLPQALIRSSFVIWYMGFEHLDLAILCLLMLKIITVSYSHQSIQTVGLLRLCQIPAALLCGKILNFFRALLAGFVQSFPYGCLPCDTFHVTGALKGHQSLWNWHPAANQQSSKLTRTQPCGGVWDRERQLVAKQYMIWNVTMRHVKCLKVIFSVTI